MSLVEADRHFENAITARRSGRVDESRQHLQDALKLRPDHAAALNLLGLDALEREDERAAVALFAEACDADAAAAELWFNLARAHAQLDEIEPARQALEHCLTVDQRFLPALVSLGQLHEAQAQHELAAERWKAVLAIATKLPENASEYGEIIAHARAYLAGRTAALSEALGAALREPLGSASARDQRRMRAATDAMLGRRAIYANECHGFHYPFLPADEFFDREHFPWLAALEDATDEIRAELDAILTARRDAMEPYVAQPLGVPENKWSPLDRSLDWSALHLWRDGERVDEACALAPRTAALVEQLPLCRIAGRAPAVFFSLLKAGKHIPPHTGVTNVRAIVHLPLIVPEGCTFRVGGEARSWREGEAFVFDDTIEHEARNTSDRDRAVLIIDTWNPHLSEAERAMIQTIYAVTDGQKDGATGAAVPLTAD